MGYVRSRKFCCCIPVRLGVVLISSLGFLGGGLITIGGIIEYRKHENRNIALVVQIILYGLLTALSVLGLIGAIAKLRRLVSLYYIMLTIHLTFSICSGSFYLFRIFNNKVQVVNDCVKGSDHPSRELCEKSASVIRGATVALFIVMWLIEIWTCVIVNDYNKQLMEEEDENLRHKDIERPQW